MADGRLEGSADRQVGVGHHLLVTASYARREVASPLAHRRPPSWEMVRRRSGAFAAFLAALPPTLAERRRLRRRQEVADADLLRWATTR